MVSLNYHHGTRVHEAEASPAVPFYNRFGVVGIIGTAEDADAATFPLNTPVLLLAGAINLAAKLGTDNGTLTWAIPTLIAEGASFIVVVRVAEGSDAADTQANVVGTLAARTGVYAFLDTKERLDIRPRILIAPGFTNTYLSDGLASITLTSGGANLTEVPTVTFTGGGSDAGKVLPTVQAILGVEGTADEGKVTGFTIVNAGANMDEAPTVAFTGGGDNATLPSADANVGDAMNPVVAALGVVAHDRSVTARAYVDGPGTTDDEAVNYRNAINNGRIMVIDHPVLMYDPISQGNVARPGSVIYAGVRARIATEDAVARPVDNEPVRSALGVSRIIRYPAQTNYLNARQVNVFLKRDGIKTWGSRLAVDDPLWQFDSVRAVGDLVNETIAETLMKFVGRRMTIENVTYIIEAVAAILRKLQATGNIYGGRCEFPRNLNTPDSLAAGRIFLDVTFEPVGVIEAIEITAHRDIAYYQVLVDQVAGVLRETPFTAVAA
jgi:phage tail sheath protein FI